MPTARDFEQYDAFASLYRSAGGFDYFRPAELLARAGARRRTVGRVVENPFPPRRVWPHLLLVGAVADRLRRVLGSPGIVLSAYRSESYNRTIGGASRSTHLDGLALDLRFRDGTPSLWADAARSLRNEVFTVDTPIVLDVRHARVSERGLSFVRTDCVTAFRFRGGLGIYRADDSDGFLHIDVRGTNVSWTQ